MKYDLDKIREAAKQQRIEYRGGRRGTVHRTVTNYGYTLTDVIDCIISLSPSNFLSTSKYGQTIDDSYLTKHFCEELGIEDEIFMKLRLLDDGNIEIVEIGTIHLRKR